MSKIVFQGKEYNSLADMPLETRFEYFRSKAGYNISQEKPGDKLGLMSDGMKNVSREVREMYERVRSEVDTKPFPTKKSPVDELPKTEDLYRRSAPAGMQNMPSDEIVYKPSPPLIEPPPPVIEPDQSLRRTLIFLGLVLALVGVALAVYFGL